MTNHRGMWMGTALILIALFSLVPCAVSAFADAVPQAASAAEPIEPASEPSEPEVVEVPVVPEAPEAPLEGETSEASDETVPQARTDEAVAEASTYALEWDALAFSGQTVNFQDEIVLGLGATCTIDPLDDIRIAADGEPIKSRKSLRFSYDSSNADHLTVDQSGTLRAVGSGSAQLMVTVHFPDGAQRQLRKHVKVVDAPAIRFAPSEAVLESGDSLDFSQFARVPILRAVPNVNAGVRFSIEPLITQNQSRVSLDAHSGRLTATYDTPGDAYLITAETYSGEIAFFTLLLGRHVHDIEIFSPDDLPMDSSGRPIIAPGATARLTAIALDFSGEFAMRQDIYWSIASGGAFATIDDHGLLEISPSAPDTSISVFAAALDGSDASASITFLIRE